MPSLCGYKEGTSSQDGFLELVEKWKTLSDQKGFGVVIMMDLFKAFDTRSHSPLIANLEAYKFGTPSLKLISLYLKVLSATFLLVYFVFLKVET